MVSRRPALPLSSRLTGLQGTQTEQKNELLYAKFGINYAKLPARFRKVRRAVRARKPLPCNHHSASQDADGAPAIRAG